jgi:competence protein ComEC
VLVIAPRAVPPPDCAATVIGRALWRDRGALALRRTAAGFAIDSARSKNFDRPWAPQHVRAAVATDASGQGAPRAQPRDATPRTEDLEAGE